MSDELSYTTRNDSETRLRQRDRSVTSSSGGVRIVLSDRVWRWDPLYPESRRPFRPPSPGFRHTARRAELGVPAVPTPRDEPALRVSGGASGRGFAARRESGEDFFARVFRRAYVVPYWFLTALAATPPLAWLAAAWRRRHRRRCGPESRASDPPVVHFVA